MAKQGKILQGQLYLSGITNDDSPLNILYYNDGEISYGQKPTVGGVTYQISGQTTFSGNEQIIDTYENTKDFAVYYYSLNNSNTNKRSGIITINNNLTVVFMNESTTSDIGDTTGVDFSVDINSGDVRLLCSAPSGTWVCKYIKNII